MCAGKECAIIFNSFVLLLPLFLISHSEEERKGGEGRGEKRRGKKKPLPDNICIQDLLDLKNLSQCQGKKARSAGPEAKWRKRFSLRIKIPELVICEKQGNLIASSAVKA